VHLQKKSATVAGSRTLPGRTTFENVYFIHIVLPKEIVVRKTTSDGYEVQGLGGERARWVRET
jgi:hypothetical protein